MQEPGGAGPIDLTLYLRSSEQSATLERTQQGRMRRDNFGRTISLTASIDRPRLTLHFSGDTYRPHHRFTNAISYNRNFYAETIDVEPRVPRILSSDCSITTRV